MISVGGEADFEQLGDFVQLEMARLHVPGVALGIYHEGQENVAGFGVTSVENPLPVTTDTLFQIGSVTKTFNATAVMRLVEQGNLDLDRPIRAYLPDFRLADESVAARVSLRHLLTHTAGVADYWDDTGEGDDAQARVVAGMAHLRQLAPLGQWFSYCDAGHFLVARVIEVVTALPYEKAVKELIFRPLGLSRSFYATDDLMTYRCAVGHAVVDNRPTVVRPWFPYRALNAPGGIVSTVHDQLAYARFHLGRRTPRAEEQVLTLESLAELHRPSVHAGRLEGAAAIGWLVRERGGVSVVRHLGLTLGQAAILVLAPEQGFALTVLANAYPGFGLVANVASWALGHYLKVADPEPEPVSLPSDQLAAHAGHYEQTAQDLVVSVRDDELILQPIPTRGFPFADSPIPPSPPPSRLALSADDSFVAVDPPLGGAFGKGEFLRDSEGRIGWLRFGVWVGRRVDAPSGDLD